jgi:hypothetical protein
MATRQSMAIAAVMTWLAVGVVIMTTGCISTGQSFYGAPAMVNQAQIPRLWAWAGTPVTIVDDRKPPPNYVAPADGISDTWRAYSKEIVDETRRIMLEAIGPAKTEPVLNILVTIVDYRVQWNGSQWVGISTITAQARRLDVVDQEWTGQAQILRTSWRGGATAVAVMKDAYAASMVDLLTQMETAKPPAKGR